MQDQPASLPAHSYLPEKGANSRPHHNVLTQNMLYDLSQTAIPFDTMDESEPAARPLQGHLCTSRAREDLAGGTHKRGDPRQPC